MSRLIGGRSKQSYFYIVFVVFLVMGVYLLFLFTNRREQVEQIKTEKKNVTLKEDRSLLTLGGYQGFATVYKNTDNTYHKVKSDTEPGLTDYARDTVVIKSDVPGIWYCIQRTDKGGRLIIDKLTVDRNFQPTISNVYNGYYRYQLYINHFKMVKHKGFIDQKGAVYKIIPEDEGKKIFEITETNYPEEQLLKRYKKIIGNEGGLYVNDSLRLNQVGVKYGKFEEYYAGGLVENALVLSGKNKEIIKIVESGFIPKVAGENIPALDNPVPLALSPDKTKVALLIRFETPDYKWYKIDPAPVWLCVFNLKTMQINRITPLNVFVKRPNFDSLVPMTWNNIDGEDIVSLSISSTSYEDEKKLLSNTILINVNKKKIMKTWPWRSKSLRWSPDGRYLGILRAIPRYGATAEDFEKDGTLYTYEYSTDTLSTDTLAEIDQNGPYFDFFWF